MAVFYCFVLPRRASSSLTNLQLTACHVVPRVAGDGANGAPRVTPAPKGGKLSAAEKEAIQERLSHPRPWAADMRSRGGSRRPLGVGVAPRTHARILGLAARPNSHHRPRHAHGRPRRLVVSQQAAAADGYRGQAHHEPRGLKAQGHKGEGRASTVAISCRRAIEGLISSASILRRPSFKTHIMLTQRTQALRELGTISHHRLPW